MSDDALSRRTIWFVNLAHALDHFVLLIFPTAVIVIAAERGLAYADMIGLATGAFVAFGLFSLPMGWLADRFGRRNMIVVFFAGCGVACLALAQATRPIEFAVGLFVLGLFTAIYHPIGSAMLVTHARSLGRDLGWNGVWGNIGAATASGVTAALAGWLGWRAAFIVPGAICLALAPLFAMIVRGDGVATAAARKSDQTIAVDRPKALLAVFAVALVAGGLTFNITTIGLPKVLDERLGFALDLGAIGSLATAVFMFGALTQIAVGRLIERYTLPQVFAGLAVLQPLGLALAASNTGWALLAGMTLTMIAIYGQVIVNDAMIARYIPATYRTRAFSVRYFLGFTASGVAVPLIALLHGQGAFPLVLAVTAGVGLVVMMAAFAFAVFAQPRTVSAAAAE
jgi:MFS family permease